VFYYAKKFSESSFLDI